MKLSVKDRIVFAGLYPKNYNLIEGTLLKDIKQKVEITQDEIKDFEIKTTQVDKITRFNWNTEKKTDIEIVFTEMEINFLKERVKELDKEKKLNDEIIDLAQKIIKA